MLTNNYKNNENTLNHLTKLKKKNVKCYLFTSHLKCILKNDMIKDNTHIPVQDHSPIQNILDSFGFTLCPDPCWQRKHMILTDCVKFKITSQSRKSTSIEWTLYKLKRNIWCKIRWPNVLPFVIRIPSVKRHHHQHNSTISSQPLYDLYKLKWLNKLVVY